jgi:hypothetical protein
VLLIERQDVVVEEVNNPLSPPCMTPNPGFHDPSAKSKSLATNGKAAFRTGGCVSANARNHPGR